MPDLNRNHRREGEYDDAEVRHNLAETPESPGKATATGAVAGGVLGAVIGGGGQATIIGAAAGAAAGPAGIAAGAALGAAIGAALGAAAGYGIDTADRGGEIQSTETGTLNENPAYQDRDDRASRPSGLDSQMTAAEFMDDTTTPSQTPHTQARHGWQSDETSPPQDSA